MAELVTAATALASPFSFSSVFISSASACLSPDHLAFVTSTISTYQADEPVCSTSEKWLSLLGPLSRECPQLWLEVDREFEEFRLRYPEVSECDQLNLKGRWLIPLDSQIYFDRYIEYEAKCEPLPPLLEGTVRALPLPVCEPPCRDNRFITSGVVYRSAYLLSRGIGCYLNKHLTKVSFVELAETVSETAFLWNLSSLGEAILTEKVLELAIDAEQKQPSNRFRILGYFERLSYHSRLVLSVPLLASLGGAHNFLVESAANHYHSYWNNLFEANARAFLTQMFIGYVLDDMMYRTPLSKADGVVFEMESYRKEIYDQIFYLMNVFGRSYVGRRTYPARTWRFFVRIYRRVGERSVVEALFNASTHEKGGERPDDHGHFQRS